jgi:hypothetical protein
VEQFEDDPLEFVRRDLAVPGVADTATRRQAAADVLQALVGSGFEVEATDIVGNWISTGLQEYRSNPSQNWRSKDSAIYLLTAVAAKGWTTQVPSPSVFSNESLCVTHIYSTASHPQTSLWMLSSSFQIMCLMIFRLSREPFIPFFRLMPSDFYTLSATRSVIELLFRNFTYFNGLISHS